MMRVYISQSQTVKEFYVTIGLPLEFKPDLIVDLIFQSQTKIDAVNFHYFYPFRFEFKTFHM